MPLEPPDRYPRSASRLLLAMSRSHAGWSAQHVDALLTGFGFVERDSGAHTFYRHPAHPELALAVPRTRRLRPYLVADAVRLVGQLLAAEAQEPQ
jgi:predicted RNA binding protein YcfA (HicA-like mRNA interferase family)